MYNYEVSCGRIGVAGGTWGACEERERERERERDGRGRGKVQTEEAVPCVYSASVPNRHISMALSVALRLTGAQGARNYKSRNHSN